MAVALGLALSGSFEGLLILTNVSALLVYIAVALAAWQLRRHDVRSHGDPFIVPGGPLVPMLTCLIIVGVIVAMVTWREAAAVAAVIAVSIIVYLFKTPVIPFDSWRPPNQ